MISIKWEDDVAKHDFEAAFNYLSLRYTEKVAKDLVKALRKAKITQRRANDILRATDHPPLPLIDPGVMRDNEKVLRGERLSPVLVISFDEGGEIADGYHRVSLAYSRDPFGVVPLRIASVSK